MSDRPVAPDPVRLFLRGEACALLADGRRVPLERKEAGLLAYLALEGPSSRSRLAGLLWPDGCEEGARANLRQRLMRLKRSVGEAVVDDRHALRLASGVRVDTDGTGELLSTLHYDDCPEFAEWLSRRRCAAQAQDRERLLSEAQRLVDADRFGDAVRVAEQAISTDPIAEESYRRLMRWYYLRGDRSAAIAVWDRCKEVLRREYGVAPCEQTAQLGRAILEAERPTTINWPPRAIPITVLRPPRLVGRAPALRKLRAAWSSGQLFVLSGEGGIGKSRLLAELVGNDASVLIAAARPGDAAVPFSTLARLVSAARERFKPELDGDVAADVGRLVAPLGAPAQPARDLPSGARRRLRFVASLESFARACRARGAYGVVIDDLQFADNASAALLHALFDPARASQAAWRAGFATRCDEMNAGARGLVDGLKGSWQVVHVELAPLDIAAIGRLLESLQIGELRSESWTRALAQHVGGNPAFLLESIKTILVEGSITEVPTRLPVPSTVQAAVQRRLEQLDPDVRTLAQLAAVAATAFSVSLAATALGKPPLKLTAAFAELERLQILKGSAFVHDIVQEATLRSVPEAIRQVMHRTVAEYLESVGGAPGLIAAHWQACAEWERAGRHWLAAADAATVHSRSATSAAAVDAADFLARAKECLARRPVAEMDGANPRD